MTDFAAITEPPSALDQEVSAVKDLAFEQIGPAFLSTVQHFRQFVEHESRSTEFR